MHPDNLALCPPGVPGELLIGGIGVSRGYHERPDLTSEKFVKNPFAAEGLVYRSGDRVKWNDDGELVFLGRFDHQVKVRGHRIELGEIEAALTEKDCVGEAVVLAHKDRLVAFVVKARASPEGANEASLKESLEKSSRLPKYMIPWKIVVVERFPLTPNGKIDRRALPMPDTNAPSEAPFVAPATPTEAFLRDLFEDLLPVDRVGALDDFADLGGHSLLVTRAVGRIRREYGVDSFSSRSFLSLRTPRRLGSAIDMMGREDDGGRVVGKRKDGSAAALPIDVLVSTSVTATLSCEDGPLSRSCPDRQRQPAERERSRDSSDRLHYACKFVAICVLSAALSISLLPAFVLSEFLPKDLTSSPLWMYDVKFLLVLCAAIACTALLVAFFTWSSGKVLLLCIGRKECVIQRGSPKYVAWYVFDRLWFLTGNVATAAFGGTVWLPWIYRMFGADIGVRTFIEDSFVRVPFLLSIGDCSVVETEATLKTVSFHLDGSISFGTIEIESDTVIGAHSVMGMGSCLRQFAWVKGLSHVESGATVPERTIVQGTVRYDGVLDLKRSELSSAKISWWNALLPLINFLPHFFAIVYYAGAIPVALFKIHHNWYYVFTLYVAAFPLIRVVGQTLMAFLIIPIRFALNGGRAQPCSTEVYSTVFCRRWTASKLYKARCGAKIGSILSKYLSAKLFGARLDVQASFLLEPEEPDLTSSGRNLFCGGGCKMRNVSFEPGGNVAFNKIQIGNNTMILDRE